MSGDHGVETRVCSSLARLCGLYGAGRALLRPAGIRGAILEAGWLGVHLATYPLGLLAERLRPAGPFEHFRTDHLSPVQRSLIVGDVRAAGTPILLVHGIIDNRSAFAVLARTLRRRGFGLVCGVNYGVLTGLTGDVRGAAAKLGEEVERICRLTGADQVHIVGHSLGGLLARYYVQRLGGDERVHTVITLGSPHSGTLTAHLLPTPVARQLRPGSDVMAELAEPAPGCRTRFVALWSELDQVVIPQRSGRVHHPDLQATNIRLRDVGHLGLAVDPRAMHAVAIALAQLDADIPGTTLDPTHRVAGLPDEAALR